MIGLNIFLLFDSLLIVLPPWIATISFTTCKMTRGSCIIGLVRKYYDLKTHLEYFALLVEKVRMWQKVAITHRRLYNERMKKA